MQGGLSPLEVGVSEGFSSFWSKSLIANITTAQVASTLAPHILSQGLCRYLNPKS